MAMFRISIFISVSVAVFGCAIRSDSARPVSASAATSSSRALKIIDEGALDRTVDPCDNFYQYSCGGWLKNTTLPDDETSVYRVDLDLKEQIRQILKRIVTAYSEGNFSTPSTHAKLLGDYYASCMDEDGVEKTRLPVFRQRLQEIDAIRDTKTFAREVAVLHLFGVNAFFSFTSGQDFNNATRVVGFADQGGMALPDRDYYFKTDPKSLELLKRYGEHISRSYEHAGMPEAEAEKEALVVREIETRLASKALRLEDRRDPVKLNHPIGRKGLKKLAPEFEWDEYFRALGLENIQAITVKEPEFYKNLSEILEKTQFKDLKAYLKWEVIVSVASHLDEESLNEHFDFWGRYLNGQKEMEPRWKRCLGAFEGGLTEALGEAYVRRVFGKESKARVEAMVVEIKRAFGRNLDTLAWLDAGTKWAARRKLDKLADKVGYPDRWKSLEGVSASRTSFLQNLFSVREFETQRLLKKIGRPVDRWEWDMPPQEINAYYNPQLNEMVFPAGILQPPSFDMDASEGANYGNTGGTMAHELSHGFDDEGSRYDAVGNVKEWWSKGVRKRFNDRAQCFARQAESYPIRPGLKINGQATLGENIADQGGAKLALAAFLQATSRHSPAPAYAGFDEIQQFFVSYAQSWCNKRTEESLRKQIFTDYHPPAEYRVNGVVANMPAFTAAFHCKEGAPMVPRDRCAVW